MAWNPEPEVAAARDFGKKFNKPIVVIVAISDTKLQVTTYGQTIQLCGMAAKIGDVAYDAIMEYMDEGGE